MIDRGRYDRRISTVKDIAEQWGVTPRTVQTLCAEGKVEGTTKFGYSQGYSRRCGKANRWKGCFRRIQKLEKEKQS